MSPSVLAPRKSYVRSFGGVRPVMFLPTPTEGKPPPPPQPRACDSQYRAARQNSACRETQPLKLPFPNGLPQHRSQYGGTSQQPPGTRSIKHCLRKSTALQVKGCPTSLTSGAKQSFDNCECDCPIACRGAGSNILQNNAKDMIWVYRV